MKIILIETVESLGLVGETKEVKEGYARNFLFPKKLAVRVGDPKAKEVIEKARKAKLNALKEVDEIKATAAKLADKILIFKAKVGEKGKLFGAIGRDEIAKELKVDEKKIEVEPIKELGEHEVTVKFGHSISAKVKVKVEAEEKKTAKK